MQNEMPNNFVYLSEYNPSILQEVRYATEDNFLGRRVKGYNRAIIIMTVDAAKALTDIQNKLMAKNLSLKIFDAFRPQMACDDFWDWAHDSSDTKMKHIYYPEINDKKELFNGYIIRYSNHSRGSTVDLTIVDSNTGHELDMGGSFDYFGEISHTDTALVSDIALQNRHLLKHYMTQHGFKNYWREWWHYELIKEPFTRKPEDHFNFVIQ